LVVDGKSLDKNKQNKLTLVVLIMTAPGNQGNCSHQYIRMSLLYLSTNRPTMLDL